MARPNTSQIREAVCKHHGGFDGAAQNEIMILWNSLEEETRKRYIQSLSTAKSAEGGKGKQDARSDRPSIEE